MSTIKANGVLNAAPSSFFNVVADDPPFVMLSFNRRSDGTTKDTVENIRRTGEFVVNLVDEAIANGMVSAGQELPGTESEFSAGSFTPAASVVVAPPRILEAPASLECRLRQRLEIGAGREIILGLNKFYTNSIVHFLPNEDVREIARKNDVELPVAKPPAKTKKPKKDGMVIKRCTICGFRTYWTKDNDGILYCTGEKFDGV